MLKNKASSISTEQRNVTRLRVLEHIRRKGAISRIDIAGALQTSPATVTTATADLLSAGLIHEVEGDPQSGSPRRGRPRVLLKLNGGSLLIAGFKVTRHYVSVLIADFEGLEIASIKYPLVEACMTPLDFAKTIRKALESACAAASVSMSDIAGVSIGIAGLIDAEHNFVHWSSSISERNVPLGPLLQQEVDCPVFIENDANLVAKAEQLFGLGKGLRNFLVITIEHGVGLGIVLGGKLYRGERGCGAEFGHTKVQLDGALCQCGQRGCLEAYVGEYALIREASIAGQDRDQITIADLHDNAQSGDQHALSVLDRAGQIFGMGVSNLINLFDPECIIISGSQVSFQHLYSDCVMERIRKGVVHVDAPLPDIKVNQWDDTMWAKGAIAYAIEQVSTLKIREMPAHAS